MIGPDRRARKIFVTFVLYIYSFAGLLQHIPCPIGSLTLRVWLILPFLTSFPFRVASRNWWTSRPMDLQSPSRFDMAWQVGSVDVRRKFSSADPSKPEISGVLGSNPAGMLCSRTVEINYVYWKSHPIPSYPIPSHPIPSHPIHLPLSIWHPMLHTAIHWSTTYNLAAPSDLNIWSDLIPSHPIRAKLESDV